MICYTMFPFERLHFQGRNAESCSVQAWIRAALHAIHQFLRTAYHLPKCEARRILVPNDRNSPVATWTIWCTNCVSNGILFTLSSSFALQGARLHQFFVGQSVKTFRQIWRPAKISRSLAPNAKMKVSVLFLRSRRKLHGREREYLSPLTFHMRQTSLKGMLLTYKYIPLWKILKFFLASRICIQLGSPAETSNLTRLLQRKMWYSLISLKLHLVKAEKSKSVKSKLSSLGFLQNWKSIYKSLLWPINLFFAYQCKFQGWQFFPWAIEIKDAIPFQTSYKWRAVKS